MMTPELAAAIRASAARLGVNPIDLGTVVSYETAGTFDPWKRGPTTQWGQHRGLIQWGEPQRQQYGVYQGMPVADQMRAAEQYLKNAGVQPGMGLLDLYSAVNAGRVGRYNASDANNGGAPGTVADKVNYQMEGHKRNAERLLALAAGEAAGQPEAAPATATAPATAPATPEQATQAQPSILGLLGAMPQQENPAQAAEQEKAVQGLMQKAMGDGQQQQQQNEPQGILSGMMQQRKIRTSRIARRA